MKRYSDYPPETQRAIDNIIAIGVQTVRSARPQPSPAVRDGAKENRRRYSN